ncbi:MAG: hypothetical protein EAX96_20855 [Candidatus Lokiarchaeota archaeon]|nr:hypothetical protein [Candidatus Lokiarchaeota archaeon]
MIEITENEKEIIIEKPEKGNLGLKVKLGWGKTIEIIQYDPNVPYSDSINIDESQIEDLINAIKKISKEL